MKNIYILFFFTLLAYFPQDTSAQCIEGAHSSFSNQGWVSCETNVGPIPERGDAHWVLYDLGYKYNVESLFLWNHNVWGETGAGVKEILIDYSIDQESWTTIGPFTIDKAPGSWKYLGSEGPQLGNVKGRYFLITVVDTWDDASECAGIGEIKFNLGEPTDTHEELANEWGIYPNPARERITITLPENTQIEEMSIYNAVGQLISNLTVTSGQKMIVPISELETGMYFLTIRSDEEVWSKEFVKVE